MKVVITGNHGISLATFPRLMRVKNNPDKIVYMIDATRGVVLSQGGGSQKVGEYHGSFSLGLFEDFPGTITLEN